MLSEEHKNNRQIFNFAIGMGPTNKIPESEEHD